MKQEPFAYTGSVFIDKSGGESGLPRIEHDLTDTPIEGADEPRLYNAFTSSDGKYSANVWACNAGTLRIENLEVCETGIPVQGTVEITDLQGDNKQVYGPGDAFVLPLGFSGYFHMPEPFIKYNIMYEDSD